MYQKPREKETLSAQKFNCCVKFSDVLICNKNCIDMLFIYVYWSPVKAFWWRWVAPLKASSSIIFFIIYSSKEFDYIYIAGFIFICILIQSVLMLGVWLPSCNQRYSVCEKFKDTKVVITTSKSKKGQTIQWPK